MIVNKIEGMERKSARTQRKNHLRNKSIAGKNHEM